MNVNLSVFLIVIAAYVHHVQGMWGMGVGDRGGRGFLHHSLIGYGDTGDDSSSPDSSFDASDYADFEIELDNDAIESNTYDWANNTIESMAQKGRELRLSLQIEYLRCSSDNYDDLIKEGRCSDKPAIITIATLKSILQALPSSCASDNKQKQHRADKKMVRPKHALFETKKLRSSANRLIAYLEQQKVTSYGLNALQEDPALIEKMSEQGQRAAYMMLKLSSAQEQCTSKKIHTKKSAQCSPHTFVPPHQIINSSKKFRIQQPMQTNNR